MKKFLFILFLLFFLVNFNSFNVFAATSVGGSSVTGDAIGSYDTTYSSDMQQVLCNVLNFVTGSIGKTIAAFIIIGVGLGFFTGKCSWGVLIGVTLGITCMFGAPAIIASVTGDSAKGKWCESISRTNP